MKERKYKEEYKLETHLDERTGKPKQVPVYMGDWYMLPGGEKRRSLPRALLTGLGGFGLAYIAYMMMGSPSSYCIYVLPLACCACIPLLYAVMGAVTALRAPEKMTRVQKETGVARLLRSFLGCGILTSMAFAGDVVFMLTDARRVQEIPAALALGLAAVMAWMGFTAMRRLHGALHVLPGKASQDDAEDERA